MNTFINKNRQYVVLRMALLPRCFFFLISIIVMSGCVTTTDSRFDKQISKEESLQSYIQLAMGYIRKGDTVGAKRPIKRAMKIDPDSPEVHNALALMYQLEEENELAEKHFRIALNHDQQFSRGNNNFGAFLFKQQRYSEAITFLTLAASDTMYENRGHAFENLGLCQLHLGDYYTAKQAFEKALVLDSNQSRALVELTDLHRQASQYEDAQSYYSQFVTLVRSRQTGYTPRSLWVGIRLEQALNNQDAVASYGLLLKNLYPDSGEYQLYKQTIEQL